MAGFLIYSINGTPVTSMSDVCAVVDSASPGQTLRVRAYNIDAGTDPTKLSAEEGLAGSSVVWGTDLKMPSS